MATFTVVAWIPEIQYEAIRGILQGHCPKTYEEWFDFHTQKVGNLLSKGHTYKEFQIDAQEFADFCDRHRGERSLHGLDNFAFARWKATADKT